MAGRRRVDARRLRLRASTCDTAVGVALPVQHRWHIRDTERSRSAPIARPEFRLRRNCRGTSPAIRSAHPRVRGIAARAVPARSAGPCPLATSLRRRRSVALRFAPGRYVPLRSTLAAQAAWPGGAPPPPSLRVGEGAACRPLAPSPCMARGRSAPASHPCFGPARVLALQHVGSASVGRAASGGSGRLRRHAGFPLGSARRHRLRGSRRLRRLQPPSATRMLPAGPCRSPAPPCVQPPPAPIISPPSVQILFTASRHPLARLRRIQNAAMREPRSQRRRAASTAPRAQKGVGEAKPSYQKRHAKKAMSRPPTGRGGGVEGKQIALSIGVSRLLKIAPSRAGSGVARGRQIVRSFSSDRGTK